MFDCELKPDSAELVTVIIKGALVLGSPTERLRSCLKSVTDRYPTVRVDATELKFMDSSGLGELVFAYSEANARGGKVELVGVTNHIKNLLVLTKLIAVFGTGDELQGDRRRI